MTVIHVLNTIALNKLQSLRGNSSDLQKIVTKYARCHFTFLHFSQYAR